MISVVCIIAHNNYIYFWIVDNSNLKLPPKQKKRGRPKGSELTVIGLPKKKHRDDGPVALIKKHPKEKKRGI